MRPRRRRERFVRRLETEFAGEDGKTYRAFSSDFSRYGLFIRTKHALKPDTELAITIHLPDGTSSRVRGLVIWAIKTPFSSMKNGMGIELTERDHVYRRFLKEFDPGETAESAPSADEHTRTEQQPHRHNNPEPQHRATPGPDDASGLVVITCPHCGAKNRARRDSLTLGPKCGKCGSPLARQA